MKTTLSKSLLLATLLLVSGSSIVRAQSYSITWYKIAGGGGISTNASGQYSLSGTIGQHDASSATTGGNYSLTGGFWALYAVQTPGTPLLSITNSGNNVVVSWPQPSTGFILQTNSNLATTNWVNYTGPVISNSVTNPTASGKLFFRLANP